MSNPLNNKEMSYRAGVAAIIINDQKEFLLAQLTISRPDEWDFIKGGMHKGETHEDTLHREIGEELGMAVEYQILRKSNFQLIYDWNKDLQQEKGFLGQARNSFWVLYKSGSIEINTNELRTSKWFTETELFKVLNDSENLTPFQIDTFRRDWESVKQEFFEENKSV